MLPVKVKDGVSRRRAELQTAREPGLGGEDGGMRLTCVLPMKDRVLLGATPISKRASCITPPCKRANRRSVTARCSVLGEDISAYRRRFLLE